MSYQKWFRGIAAPLSVIICMIVIFNVYSQDHGQAYEPPPILNTTFRYWTQVPGTNETKPYLWEEDFIKGPGDLLWTRQDVVENEVALGMHVYQDGLNDTFDWAMLHVRQDLRGNAAARVFRSNIGLLVYPTFNYHPDPVNNNPRNAFGVEINDGTYITWFIFSPGDPVTYEFKLHRIIIVPTPLNEWSYREVNIREQYQAAKWPTPGSFSFILITGATKLDPGSYAGYFKSIVVTDHSFLATEAPQGTLDRPSYMGGTRKK